MVGKATILALVALLAIVSGAQGRQLLQGTNNTGSGNSSTVVVRWAVPANGVLDAVRVPLGGNVTFSWTGRHDVWEIPSAQCPATFANSSTIKQIAPQSTGGTVTVPFNSTNVRYFACSVTGHCQDGQLIAVRVGGATAPAPGPQRSDRNGYGGNSSPGYAGGGSSNYGSSGNSSSSGNSGYGEDGVNRTPGYGGGSSSNYGSGSGK